MASGLLVMGSSGVAVQSHPTGTTNENKRKQRASVYEEWPLQRNYTQLEYQQESKTKSNQVNNKAKAKNCTRLWGWIKKSDG